MVRPNRREREIAHPMLRDMVSRHRMLDALASYREEIIKPLEDLREECVGLRDTRMEKRLTSIIDMLRGEP